jgi:hypothetical protein
MPIAATHQQALGNARHLMCCGLQRMVGRVKRFSVFPD